MTTEVDTRTLEALLLQAKVAPPRDMEARYAISDVELLLERNANLSAGSSGQLTLFS